MQTPIQPSKQQRSRETQARVLEATAQLLKTSDFQEISVRRILAEANTSIGAFYARFRDKEALLPALYDADEQRLVRRLQGLHTRLAHAADLETVARRIAEHFVQTYGENPNLSRAVFEYATRAPESELATTLSDKRRQQYRFLVDALLVFRNRIAHSDPTQAVEVGLYFLTVTCRNRLFYPNAPQARTLKLSKRALTRELARALVGYLTVVVD